VTKPAERPTVVVVAGGDTPDQRLATVAPADAVVVAADSGVDHAHGLGLTVDHAVGDFDSVSPGGLATVEERGGRITRHPMAKDATDLELALCAAYALGPERIVVIGGHGGRADHHLSLPLALTASWLAGVAVEAWTGAAHLTVIRHRATLEGRVGALVSLLPVHGPASGS
jgi:thiamine pyrophosphokinase